MKIPHKKLLKLNLFLAILVFCLPVLLYVYLLFPQTTILDCWFFSFEIVKFKDVQSFLYFFLGKIYLILFLSIWFFTISDWWRFFLFPTIVLVFSQACTIFVGAFGVGENYLSIGLGLGVLYILVLHLLHRPSKIYRADTIHMLTFDIIKLISSYANEKKLVKLKQKIIAEKETETSIGNQIDRLNDKIRTLQSYVTHNGKFVYMYFIKKLDIKIECLIAFLLLLAPAILNAYYFLPINSDGLFRVMDFSYDTKFESLRLFFYYFNIKFVHIYMLSIWFFTTRTILKYGVFFNIIIALFQILQILDNTASKVDESELFRALPVVIPILLIFLLLHKIIKYKSRNDLLNDKIEQEIQEVIEELSTIQVLENNVVNELIVLRANKHKFTEKDYFEQLKIIKAKLQTSNFN